ncbi:MAG: glycosyl hydrolase family 8 [Fibromonadales bacterium]|nr:glycosyl hydrolase family 8 [Fibromonadales bacterium]
MKKIALLLVLCAFCAYSAVNYPYPQETNYGNGSINVTSPNASSNLKSKFQGFLSGFYEEGTCSRTGACARIKFDTPTQTVSEGIAYGMLMTVYFSDNATSYQSHFDKLWAYYQNWLNGNGLMHWQINGFSDVAQSNAASDAEFDAALALVMAHYQFGSTSTKNYLDTAKALIAKIRQYEIDPSNLHRPGDSWNSERNPSYVSPAAFEIFKEVESNQAAKWQSVIDANYTLLARNQHSTTGLFSDWCNDNGVRTRQEYEYDAARTPWRLAWAYNWYGHSEAKTLLTNLYTRFLNGKSANNIGGPINYSSGSMGNHRNSTFLGPFTNALSYSSEHQTTMNSYWAKLIGHSNESYYNHALQVLTGLLVSGNMPNLKALASGNNDNTPILLPQIATSNHVAQTKNGISLSATTDATIAVYNLNGTLVSKQNYASGVYKVSFGHLPKGMYIVRVSFGSNVEVLHVPIK